MVSRNKKKDEDYDKELAKYQQLIPNPTVKFYNEPQMKSELGTKKIVLKCEAPRFIFSEAWYNSCGSTIESIIIDPDEPRTKLTTVKRCPRCKTLWTIFICYFGGTESKDHKFAFDSLAIQISNKTREFYDKKLKYKEKL